MDVDCEFGLGPGQCSAKHTSYLDTDEADKAVVKGSRAFSFVVESLLSEVIEDYSEN